MSTVTISVSGVTFEFSRKLVNDDRFQHHTLYTMCDEFETPGKPLDFKIDRSSDIFASILSYYQTEKLHMPLHVCPGQFKDEMEYWGIDPNILESCCLYRYFTFLDEMESHKAFRDSQFTRDPLTYSTTATSCFQKFRQRTWNIVDNQERTISAKVYTAVLFLFVVVSIVGMAYSTVPSLRRSLTVCEYKEYLDATNHKYSSTFERIYEDIDCSSGGSQADTSSNINLDDMYSTDFWTNYFADYFADFNTDTTEWPSTDTSNSTDSTGTFTKKRPLDFPVVTAQNYAFDVLEYVVISYFTMDFLLRIFSCPSICRYFTSFINIVDVFALVASIIHLGVVNVHAETRYVTDSWIKSLGAIQILRVLRVLRIAKNVRASRVLSFSLKQNVKDMLLLGLFLFLSVSLFSNLLYFVEPRETIQSIPQGWYWSVVTLTTVGYGDISPKTGPGMLISSICAVTGVLLLAVTLPMFVNNFLTLYQFSSIDDTIERKRKAAKSPNRKQSSLKSLFLSGRLSRQVSAEVKDEKQNKNEVFTIN